MDSAGKALAGGALVSSSGALRGVTVAETAAAAATIRLYDNSSGSGVLLAAINLAANGSADLNFVSPRRFAVGVYAVITGTVVGSIWT